MSKYLKFTEVDKKAKTSVYDVYSKTSETFLGEIKWYSPWRQYCFCPTQYTVFNTQCMMDIIEFIKKLMDSRKKKR